MQHMHQSFAFVATYLWPRVGCGKAEVFLGSRRSSRICVSPDPGRPYVCQAQLAVFSLPKSLGNFELAFPS